ncbi:hypothetical protein HZC53_00065 [Candidatus Uhrbacteria bacterium]|nr:hypothetical protein [Candidatus Uhrbacteria bacterium]
MVEEKVTAQSPTGRAELLELALVELDEDEPLFRRVGEAVWQLLCDPACPVKELGRSELGVLKSLIDELRKRGNSGFGEALAVSLRRAKCEIGWKPEELPLAAELLSGDGETYLAARHAFGIIALAWQIQKHPTDVFLTAGSLLLSLN